VRVPPLEAEDLGHRTSEATKFMITVKPYKKEEKTTKYRFKDIPVGDFFQIANNFPSGGIYLKISDTVAFAWKSHTQFSYPSHFNGEGAWYYVLEPKFEFTKR
jgi:hypothetical protein